MLTIKEVADLAGVSKATVSRVINNSGYVSPQTRLKIESIMKQYNYLPSASAVNLSRQETSTVGVVVPEIGNRFYADVVHGITEMADQMNLSLVFFSTSNSPEQEEKAIRTLRQQQVRGIILGPSVDYMRSSIGRSIHSELKALNVPIVVVDRMFENMEWDAVVYENFQSSYRAALELHKAGNRRLAILTGDLSLLIGRERFEGFRCGAEALGLTIREEDILQGNFRMDRAYELSKQMLIRGDLPDAIYCCNNLSTLGFLRAANECDIKIGEDIALLGNDRIEEVDFLGIGVSWIYRDTCQMGRVAMRMLDERIKKPDKCKMISVIPFQVELNGSEKKRSL